MVDGLTDRARRRSGWSFFPEPDAFKVSKSTDCDLTVSQPQHLSGRHRDTLLEIFQHPTSRNIEWHDVISLLDATGVVEERHDGKFRVRLGGETEVFTRPKTKDIDVQQVVDLRRMLSVAGYGSIVEDLEAKGKEV
jgi:hypothetical protein